ncbi:DUF4870 domain-containing protein [Chromatiaceae bacterium AAb-1]|nr:DUF4870 domain-containing protein [Chromatiaceae bacterium AAb-1]
MDLQQLEKLHELKEKGILSEEEFQQQKEKILAGKPSGASINDLLQDSKSYAMLLHYSQLLTFVIPVLGAVVPLLLWLHRKDSDTYVDQQGKVALNWMLSAFIYAVIGWVLLFILIGFPLLIALFIASVVFIIQGGLRAKEGVIRNYPLAIKFFSVEENEGI